MGGGQWVVSGVLPCWAVGAGPLRWGLCVSAGFCLSGRCGGPCSVGGVSGQWPWALAGRLVVGFAVLLGLVWVGVVCCGLLAAGFPSGCLQVSWVRAGVVFVYSYV